MQSLLVLCSIMIRVPSQIKWGQIQQFISPSFAKLLFSTVTFYIFFLAIKDTKAAIGRLILFHFGNNLLWSYLRQLQDLSSLFLFFLIFSQQISDLIFNILFFTDCIRWIIVFHPWFMLQSSFFFMLFINSRLQLRWIRDKSVCLLKFILQFGQSLNWSCFLCLLFDVLRSELFNGSLSHDKMLNKFIIQSNSMKLISCWIFIACLIVASVGQVSFTITSSTVSPNTARSTTSQYSLQLNAITSYSSTFDILLTFPSAFSLSAVAACQLSINTSPVSSAVCALTPSSNLITFSSINNNRTITNMTIVFTTGTALYSGSFVISLSYTQPGVSSNPYGSNSAPISINSATMNCSFLSTSAVVGANATFTLSYTPSAFISAGSILQVQFSPWSAYNLTNFPSFTSSSVCGSACTIRSPNAAQSFFSQILTYSSLYTTSTSSGNTLTIANGRNPSSTQPTSISVTLLYYISSTNQPSYMTCSTTFTAATPNTFSGITFAPSQYTLSTTTSSSLILTLTNPISSISYLNVSYSSDISVSFTFVASNQATTARVFPSGSANSFLIGTLTNSTTLFSTLFLVSFSITNAPYGNFPVPITFQSSNLVGTIYYPIDTVTLNFTFTPSSITIADVTADTYAIGLTANLVFTFTSASTLIANSKIILRIPAELTAMGNSTCVCSVSSTCSIFNSTSFIVNINSAAVTAGTSFTINLNNIVNPPTTTQSSSFSLTTYYYNTSTVTDILTKSVTITGTPVPLASASLVSSSLEVAANSTYTITFKNTNPLPAGSTILIGFPSDFPNAIGASLASVSIAGVSRTCMLAVSSMNFSIGSGTCISSSIPSQSTFIIAFSNIINPSSTKPSNSLTIQTYYNGLLMEYLYNNIIVTLTTAKGLFSSSILAVNNTVNAVTTYNFTIGFALTHYSGDRILLTIPTLMSFNTGFICSSSTSGISVSCFQSSTTLLVLTMNGSGALPNSITFSVTNLQNPWYSTSPIITFDTTTSDSIYYYMEKGTASLAISSTTLSASYVPNNQLVLLSFSTLNIQITNPFNINAPTPSLLKLVITVPSELILITSNCSASSGSSICAFSSSTTMTITLIGFTNTVNVTFFANAGYFITSSSFTSSLSYNDSLISSNSVFTINSFCQNPCKACTSVSTQCTSCLPSSYTTLINYYFGNNSCVATCPPTFYVPINSTICTSCNSSACLNCISTANTCTSCSNPYFLSGNSCLSVCPNTFYGDSNLCMPCINNCKNCSSATFCLSCVSGYSLNPDNTCLTTCPSGYTSVNSICQLCTANCVTCSGSTSTCSSCTGSYFLSSTSCVLNCPNTYFGNITSNRCVGCINNCYNCTNSTYCLSCVNGFSLNPDNTCLTTCPSGYAGVSSICTLCTANCKTCSGTTSNCTSCSSPYFLSGNSCVQVCPNTFYGSNQLCVPCINQCYNCTSSTYCFSCISGYSLNPNKTCLTTCPDNYSSVSSICVACTSNCLTCSSTPSTCTSCADPYFLTEFSCVQTCPNTYYGSNNRCLTCINQCYNCTSATYCLSCTSGYSLNPNKTCLTTCPEGYSSVSSVCQLCTSNCKTCSSTPATCASCANPYFLSGSNCLQTCPNTYYGSSNICLSCINQCYNCTTSTYCLFCLPSYSLNPDHSCQLSCPTGYVSLGSICTSCTSNCRTCSTTTSFCTSCGTGYIFYNNTCILACPLGQFQNSNSQCQTCIQPCQYCLSATSCLTCMNSYYLYNGTQCLLKCPPGMYSYVTQCEVCTDPCQTCQNTGTNCTSCDSPYYYYMNSCYENCPEPTYPYQGKCTICVEPCATCLNSALLCSSCISNYFLLNASCITSCPPTGYLIQNNTCLACPAHCLKCSSSIACSICESTHFLYQGSCVSQCPSTSPIISNQSCLSCSYECSTCVNSPDYCLTCRLFYFKYSYSCVQTCPLSYYSNIMTYTCQSGLSSKIVFFPVLITYIVIIAVILMFKLFSRVTSFQTTVTALSGWVQICISAYLLSLMSQTYLELGINYAFPQAMIAISLIFTLTISIIHFKANYTRLERDQYVRKWRDVNINYTFFIVIRYVSLTHCKFFRIIYSKILNSLHFSMVAKKFQNIFSVSTAVTVAFLVLSEIPLIIASFYLIYNKLLKDQIFYTSVECLLIVIASAVISLVDIHKSQDYFDDTEFIITKKYVDKVNNMSTNKLEEQFRDKDQGSVDGQKLIGTTGGKFIFSRRDPNSMNQLLNQQGSVITDALETFPKASKKLYFQEDKDLNVGNSAISIVSLSPRSSRSKRSLKSQRQNKTAINIFQPIQQEEGQYYQLLKYDEQDFKTAVKIEQQQNENQSQIEEELQMQRKGQFHRSDSIDNSDNISLMQYRQRRQKWNNIIEHRQKIAGQIFNTVDTGQLFQQMEKIQQPIEQQEQEEQRTTNIQVGKLRGINFEQNNEIQKQRRKRRRKGKKHGNNKELQEIYLQRLRQKVEPKKKAFNASSKNFKYQF